MKNNRTVLKAVAAAVLGLTANLAFAADTQSLVVTATVSAVCKFAAVPALNFTIDPSAATSQSGTVAVTYKCTKDQAPTISATGGLTGRTLTGAVSSTTMSYDLTLGSLSASTGFGTANSVDVTATVLAAAYQNAVADAYTESVSLTISP